MSDSVGQLDRYRLICKLGSGTFGQVYLAKDRHRGKDVAIKILPSLVNEDLPRFLTEARIMIRLKHRHIVQILDFGIDVEKQTPFLVMEYAPNGTLRQRHPKASRVPLPTILVYVTQLAAALQVAHDDQVIHRDIKPENMLLDQQDQILLSDFGIATMVPGSVLHSSQTFGGTVPYMAPEQAEGHPCPASDQYSLAVVVYEWVCGQRPFHGSPVQIAIQHRLNPPPSLREQNPLISSEVEQVVFKALAKEPMDRFASVEIFAQALEAACSAEHTLHITPSPEAPSQRLSSESSKKPVPSEKADYLSPISGDSAAALEAGAVADLVKEGAQQPSVPTTPFPPINSPVSRVASDITPPPMLDAPDPAIGTGLGVIELPPSPWLIDSRPTAKLSDIPSARALVGAEQSPVIPTPRTPSQLRSTGKIAVITGAAVSQQALNGVKAQLKQNKQLAGDPECTTQSTQDQPVGDQGHNVISANVAVSATCTGLAYDASGAQILAQNLLKKKASSLGQAYALAGTMKTKLTVTDVKDGMVTLQVTVSGTWSYQLNDKEKQTLANQLVNKTRVAAQGYLNASKGIGKAKIDIANGGDSLPDDPGQIRIIVVAASGAFPTNRSA